MRMLSLRKRNGTYTWPVNVSVSQGEYAVHDGEVVDFVKNSRSALRRLTSRLNTTITNGVLGVSMKLVVPTAPHPTIPRTANH